MKRLILPFILLMSLCLSGCMMHPWMMQPGYSGRPMYGQPCGNQQQIYYGNPYGMRYRRGFGGGPYMGRGQFIPRRAWRGNRGRRYIPRARYAPRARSMYRRGRGAVNHTYRGGRAVRYRSSGRQMRRSRPMRSYRSTGRRGGRSSRRGRR